MKLSVRKQLNLHNLLVTFFIIKTLSIISLFSIFPATVPVAQASSVRGYPLYTTGWNNTGQLARGYHADGLPNPHQAEFLRVPETEDNWVSSANAHQGGNAINVRGELFTWGNFYDEPRMGQGGVRPPASVLGDPINTGTVVSPVWRYPIVSPTEIPHPNGDRWTQVNSRHHNVVALDESGRIWRWGNAANPQHGHNYLGLPLVAYEPLQIIQADSTGSTSNWKYVTAGNSYIMAISNEGYVYAMGANVFGQLGRGLPVSDRNPTLARVQILSNVRSISASMFHAMAITYDGHLYTWGQANRIGRQVGGVWVTNAWDFEAVPARVDLGGKLVRDARVATNSSAAVTMCGDIYTWGARDIGQLGRGAAAWAVEPEPGPIQRPANPNNVPLGDRWVAISGGQNHYHALSHAGRLYGWGANGNGQLGIGNATNQSEPHFAVQTYGFSEVSRGGGNNSLFLMRTSPAAGEFNLYKHLQKPEGTPAPNLNFRFTFERNSFNNNSTSADIARILVIDPVVINPTTVVTPPPPPAGTVTLSGYADILDGIVFEEIGTFSWIIREDATHPSGVGSDSTVVFSQAEYELRVYVAQEAGTGGNLYVRFITLHRIQNADGTTPENGREKVDDLIFVNLYSYDPFITPTGLFLSNGSPYLLFLATGVLVTAYLTQKARKRIEELPIMH